MTDQPAYVPGDIVNGHVLTRMPDGSFAWLPLAPAPKPPVPASRRDIFGVPITAVSLWWRIPVSIVLAFIVLGMFASLGPLPTIIIAGVVMLACYGLGKLFRNP